MSSPHSLSNITWALAACKGTAYTPGRWDFKTPAESPFLKELTFDCNVRASLSTRLSSVGKTLRIVHNTFMHLVGMQYPEQSSYCNQKWPQETDHSGIAPRDCIDDLFNTGTYNLCSRGTVMGCAQRTSSAPAMMHAGGGQDTDAVSDQNTRWLSWQWCLEKLKVLADLGWPREPF